jgi:bifunctional non-homologous end joining protein LigD
MAEAPAEFVAPMKALGSELIPTGTWQCEIKYDGYRAQALLNSGTAELWSRNRKPLGEDYPDVTAELQKIRCESATLDGEIVALDPHGRSRFQLLQNCGKAGKVPPIVYYVFDLVYLDGESLAHRPLAERREMLAKLLGKPMTHVKLAAAFDVEPAALFAEARKHGLEGIIAKQPESRYEPDRRSGAWLKCKVLAEQEFVIGGFTPPQNSREYFGAILIGYYEAGKLLYAGKVGTGFNRNLLSSLHASFVARKSLKCPFADLPSSRRSRFGKGMGVSEMTKVTWIKPAFVAQIKFAEWTEEGLLRQPVFLGLRKDKPARDVHREPAAASHAA